MFRKKMFLFIFILLLGIGGNVYSDDFYKYSYEEEKRIAEELKRLNQIQLDIPIEDVIQKLSNDDENIRLSTVELLGRVQDTQQIFAIEELLLKDPSATVRTECAKSLALLDSINSKSVLIKALNDSDERVILKSALTLAALGEKDACFKILANFWTQGDSKQKLVCHLGLRDIATVAASEILHRALSDNDPYVAVDAAIILAQLGYTDDAFPKLQELSTHEAMYVRLAVLRGLATIGDEKSLNLVRQLLTDKEPLVSKRSQKILQDFGKEFTIKESRTSRSSSYNPDAAAQYAETWWNSRNPSYHDYGDYDCANFVSQCLIAGGLDLSAGTNGSGYGVDSYGCMYNCDQQHTHLTTYQDVIYERRYNTSSPREPLWFVKGDAAIYGNSTDRWRHSVFAVIGDDDNYVALNAHSVNQYHKSVQYFYDVEPTWTSCDFYHINTGSGGLDTPTLLSPSDGSTVTSETPLLDWGAVSGATVYRVFVSKSYTCLDSLDNKTQDCACGCVINTTTPLDYFYVLDSHGLEPGTAYYWMVRAGNADAGSPNSSIRSFKTPTAGAPDLLPYQPSGWDSKIVISSNTGTSTSASKIYDDEDIYVDYSCANNGDTTAGSFSTGLFVNGVQKSSATASSLMPYYYNYVTDKNIGKLSEGTYTFELRCDFNNQVSESNESNNKYSRTYTITKRESPPQITLTPTSYNFGNQNVNTTSSTYSFILKNTGGGTATGTVSLTGTYASQFEIYSGGGAFSLGTNVTKTVYVRFKPTAEGYKTATLMADGTSPCNDASASLAGTGVATPQITLTPTSYNFGNQNVNTASSTYSFILKNTGGGTATGTVSLTGTNADQFVISSGSGAFSLTSDQTKTIQVRFSPTGEGAKTATLTAEGTSPSNDAAASLSGTGGSSCTGQPDWSVNPADFRNKCTLTGIVYDDSEQMLRGSCDLLAAFVGDECRGVAEAEQTDLGVRYFLQVWSNVTNGETVTFRHYDSESGTVLDNIKESVEFVSNSSYGSIASPYELHVQTCENQPLWTVNQSDFRNKCTVTATVYDENDELLDSDCDILAAFVGDECRGFAEPVQTDLGIRYFLQVWSNVTNGETVTFKYFDSAGGTTYEDVCDPVEFVSNSSYGSIASPRELSVVCTKDAEIDLTGGWNWISVNVSGDDMSLDTVLSSLGGSAVQIDSQDGYAEYYSGRWYGSLSEINPASMYMIKMASPATLTYSGYPVDVTTPIPLTAGWNWIGYYPDFSLNLETALSSLNGKGIQTDSQNGYAEYYGGKWYGSLSLLEPAKGYMLKTETSGQLVYPASSQGRSRMQSEADLTVVHSRSADPGWKENDPSVYKERCNITAKVYLDQSDIAGQGDMLAGFIDGELRSGGASVAATDLPGGMGFSLQIWGDGEDEGKTVTFGFYDASADRVYDISENFQFSVNGQYGSVAAPENLTVLSGPGDVNHLGGVNLEDAILALKVITGINNTEVFTDADVNNDGKIGIQEAIYILQVVAEIRNN